jgi:EAL domain-containing protein (putative c-di-GMP-specific phosphodiesterase class I)
MTTTEISPQRTTLRAQRDRFVAFAFAAADILVEVSDAADILYVSGALSRLADHGDPVGRSLLDYVDRRDHAVLRDALKRLRQGGKIPPVTVFMRGAGGSAVPATLGACRMAGEQSRVYVTLGFAMAAGEDPGEPAARLPGGTAFDTVVERKLNLAAELDQDVAVTYVTLDGFGGYRAAVGGDAAEHLLESITHYLRSVSLDGNGAGSLADDRYAVLHRPEVGERAIRGKVNEIARQRGAATVTASTVSTTIAGGALSEADAVRALLYSLRQYEAGEPAEISFAAVVDAARATFRDTVPRIVKAREVIRNRTIELAFQPVVDLDSRRAHHFEALSRIPGYGSVAEFVGFAEDTGLIAEFDLAVLKSATDAMGRVAALGWQPAVAINLSAGSLANDAFMFALTKELRRHADLLPRLLVELTETVSVKDFAETDRRLQEIRDLGVKVCLDDVGAAGTSFQSLRALTVDFAKLDGSLISGVDRDPQTNRLLESFLGYCRETGAGLIAEFIETEAEEALVRRLGVRLGQGRRYGMGRGDWVEAYREALG